MSAFVRISRIHRVMKREKRQDAFVRLLQGLEWVSRKRLIPPWQSQAFCISFILSSATLLPLAIKHGIYSPQLGPAHEHTRKIRFGPAEPFYTDSRMRALDPRHMT